MARAEVVLVQRGVVYDYRIDQGKIVSVRQGTIELRTRRHTPAHPRFADCAGTPQRPVRIARACMLRLNAITVRTVTSSRTPFA